jgi:4-hydroxy-tetrahydrodipicolinate synthase
MSAASFAGLHVAIVTPLRASGEVDWQAWTRLVDFHLQQGTDGLVIGGTTGESVTLTDAEVSELVVRAQEQAAGRLKIVAGAGTSSTATTVRRVQDFATLPVDALLVVTPVYNRPTQEGLFRHYEAVAAASRVPLILYNVPSRRCPTSSRSRRPSLPWSASGNCAPPARPRSRSSPATMPRRARPSGSAPAASSRSPATSRRR